MPEKKYAAGEIYLRPMTEEEFGPWQIASRAEYAKDKESEGLSPEDAREVAERSFRDLLPNGVSTPDQYVRKVVETATDRPVGYLWWGVQKHGQRKIAWVYNIAIDAEFRGRGWGRATMQAAEAEVRAEGFNRFGLHVFGFNKTARSLYQSLGFEETNVVMYKNV
jgi:ribosomal protein S18 acetylase RimI-like enzyme